MRIGIDAHALGTKAGGNETYVRELLRSIREHAPDTDLVAYVNKDIHGDPGAAAGFPTFPLATRSSWLRVPFALPAAVTKTDTDLLHVQYIAPPICPCPYVVSLHDMVWRSFPETLRPIDRYRLAALVPGTLRRAAKIFCLTEAMKREAIELYHVPEDKIDVVGISVDPLFRPITDQEELAAFRRRYGLPGLYIAYTGALQPRKNLVRLATAFSRLKDHGLPHKLVITGKQSWLYGLMGRQIQDLGLGDRLVFTGYIDQEDLPRLFSAASAFAYVSLYEGFGLPVLEAMACGVPVLTSTAPALAEVASDGALCCDPLDTDAIEDSLVRVLTDERLRMRLVFNGQDRAKCFSRERMAGTALNGYARALDASRT